MDHPNILKLYDVLETNKKVYIILEHVKGGELFDYIIDNDRLPEKEAIRFLGQMVVGLQHCHAHWVCHRDLKAENLLLDENNNIKIVDFGFAQVTRRWNELLLDTPCGSPHYAAPEVISGERLYDGPQSEVWSLGVILFAMTTGLLPFEHENISILLEIVMSGCYRIPFFVSPVVTNLISKMLVVNPKKRIKMKNIRRHSAFKNYCPDLHIDKAAAAKKNIPSTPSDFTIKSKGSVPWNDRSDLDQGILKDLEALGWGSVKELKKTLMDDDLRKSRTFSSKRVDSKNRVDRAMYLLLKQRKIKRVEILEQLSPKPQMRRLGSSSAKKRGEGKGRRKKKSLKERGSSRKSKGKKSARRATVGSMGSHKKPSPRNADALYDNPKGTKTTIKFEEAFPNLERPASAKAKIQESRQKYKNPSPRNSAQELSPTLNGKKEPYRSKRGATVSDMKASTIKTQLNRFPKNISPTTTHRFSTATTTTTTPTTVLNDKDENAKETRGKIESTKKTTKATATTTTTSIATGIALPKVTISNTEPSISASIITTTTIAENVGERSATSQAQKKC